MRWVSALVVAIAISSSASGQIVAAHLKDVKAAEKYKKYLIYVKGKYMLAGEAVPGGGLTPNLQASSIQPSKDNKLFIADPSDPLKVPYEVAKDGTKSVAKGGVVISIANDDVSDWDFLMRDQSLAGLAEEYKLRLQLVNDAKAEREKQPDKSSKQWMEAHRNVINGLERLQAWLSGTLFERAAKNLEKTVLAEAKLMKDDAVAARTATAKLSVKKVEPVAELIEVNQKLTGGKLKFGVVESKHLRIIYTNQTSSPEKALGLAKLGETMIEGFRRDFIDPNVGDDIGDPIPEDIFHEFWFGPSDVKLYEQFLEQYYAKGIGADHREERLKMSGTKARGARGVAYLDYWKADEGSSDQEAMIAHGLGHSLSNIVFNNDRNNAPIDWLEEGCGYFMSFEYLGRNTVTCKDFAKREYGTVTAKEGDKNLDIGQRAEFNKLAIAKGLSIVEMSLKNLAAMDDADLAKGWSVFDFIAHKEGKKGFLWLRAGCDAAKDKNGFIERWRKETAKIFGDKAGDPFDNVEARWKAFATSGQKKDSSTKKVK